MVSETKTTEAPTLRRELKARHLTMIAIGGSIGTGLFVASGATISQAGPGGALLSYILIGLMVYFLMTSLGELAAFMPVSGSFCLANVEMSCSKQVRDDVWESLENSFFSLSQAWRMVADARLSQ